MDSRSRPVFDGDDTLWNEYRYEAEAWLSMRGYGNGLTLNDQGDGGKWTGPEKTKQMDVKMYHHLYLMIDRKCTTLKQVLRTQDKDGAMAWAALGTHMVTNRNFVGWSYF